MGEQNSAVFVCVPQEKFPQSSLDCMMVPFDSVEIEVLEDSTLKIKSSGIIVPRNGWRVMADLKKYVVCVKYLLEFDQSGTVTHKMANWMSFILVCLSMVALVITIVCYYCLEQLQTEKGVCIRSLSIAIFMSIGFFEFMAGQTEPEGLCYFTTVITHYLFLASVFWNSVMVFDVWRTFATDVRFSRLKERANRDVNLVWWYRLYAWVVPAVLVLICLIVDIADGDAHIYTQYDISDRFHDFFYSKNVLLTGSDPTSALSVNNFTTSNPITSSLADVNNTDGVTVNPTSGYADHRLSLSSDQICFLPNQRAKIWLYGVPIFTLGLFNLGVLLITLYRLQKSSQNPKTVTLRKHVITKSLSKPGKKIIKSTYAGVLGTKWQRIMVYVKLMTITGVTWSIGLLASITNQEIIIFIFQIMLASQGLFIFFAFASGTLYDIFKARFGFE